MRPTASRIDGLDQTVFARMSALAARTGAVNLGQGFPDEDGPTLVLETAARALRSGHNQYAPGPGLPVLREAIAAHQWRHHGIELDPATQVVVTTGATEGIAAAILALVDPGDEVIVLEPWYDSYVAMIQMAGGIRRPVTLRAPHFRLDVEALRAAVTPRTKLILLNTPHNPTGTVLHRAELQAVADLAVAHDLTVVTDEVYEHLVLDPGHDHVPLATLPGMFERTLTLSSVGKSWSLTGWKVGWATGPQDLVTALTSAKQWLTYTSGAPLQPAVAVALNDAYDFPATLRNSLRTRRDHLVAGLNGLGIRTYTPQGTYFALSDVADLGWSDALAFCEALPARAGVVAIPASSFYDDPEAGRHLVRWTFSKRRQVLDEALGRLAGADLRAR